MVVIGDTIYMIAKDSSTRNSMLILANSTTAVPYKSVKYGLSMTDFRLSVIDSHLYGFYRPRSNTYSR